MAGKIKANDICTAFNTFQKLDYGKGRAAAGRTLVAVVNEYVRQNLRAAPHKQPIAPPVQAPPVQDQSRAEDDLVNGIMNLLFGP